MPINDVSDLNKNYIENLHYNLDAEQSILGAIIIEPSILPNIIEKIKKEFFFHPPHKKIFEIMLQMFGYSRSIDFVTIFNEIVNNKIFETENDTKLYLTRVVNTVPSISNVDAYCNIVRNKYFKREIIKISHNIIENANDIDDYNLIIDNAEQKLFNLRQNRNSNFTKIDEIIISVYDNLQEISKNNKKYLGVSSGFNDLDNLINGLNKSDLILLAARPAMGKTSFALNIATNCGKKSLGSVAIFSLEMSKEQLVSRILSSESKISSYNFKTGELTLEDWENLIYASELLSQTEIYIDDTPGITVSEIKAKCRRLKNLELIVIDYLQLMTNGKRSENRVQEISEITRNMKIMAKELNVPIILLSQLSRAPDNRTDHKPVLSDLRESGSIEQDADIVMFLYRDHYYDRENGQENVAECIVSKNRHGETNSVKLHWEGQYTRFENLEIFRNENF